MNACGRWRRDQGHLHFHIYSSLNWWKWRELDVPSTQPPQHLAHGAQGVGNRPLVFFPLGFLQESLTVVLYIQNAMKSSVLMRTAFIFLFSFSFMELSTVTLWFPRWQCKFLCLCPLRIPAGIPRMTVIICPTFNLLWFTNQQIDDRLFLCPFILEAPRELICCPVWDTD